MVPFAPLRVTALLMITSWLPRDLLAAFCMVTPALARPAVAQDSAFHLATSDPTRSPSPAIGNGRIGVVIPALGVGASPSFLAGIYENLPGDVPRIAALPAWTAIAVFDGQRWLGSTAASELCSNCTRPS